MTKFVLNDMFEGTKLFLEWVSNSDQIKSSLFFSLWFYIQVVEVLHYSMSAKNSTVFLSYHFLKKLKMP